MTRIDKDAVLSELRHETEQERQEDEARNEYIVKKYDDPWWPANQEPIPEQYRTTPPA